MHDGREINGQIVSLWEDVILQVVVEKIFLVHVHTVHNNFFIAFKS